MTSSRLLTLNVSRATRATLRELNVKHFSFPPNSRYDCEKKRKNYEEKCEKCASTLEETRHRGEVE